MRFLRLRLCNKTLKSAILASLLFSTACSSLSRRNAESEVSPNRSELNPTDQKVENLATTVSKMQGRIEELEAKLAAISDSIESTKNVVENIAGPKDIKTIAIGSNSDGVPENPEHDEADSTAKSQSKGSPKKENHQGSSDSSIAPFAKAMNLYRKSSYSDAVLAFNQFVEQSPDHALAGSAQFYAGESYFMMGEYGLALPEFQKMLTTFPNSPRVPAAMVRVAHCHQLLGNQKQADRELTLVAAAYPNHPALEWTLPSRDKNKPQERPKEGSKESQKEAPQDSDSQRKPSSTSSIVSTPMEPAHHP